MVKEMKLLASQQVKFSKPPLAILKIGDTANAVYNSARTTILTLALNQDRERSGQEVWPQGNLLVLGDETDSEWHVPYSHHGLTSTRWGALGSRTLSFGSIQYSQSANGTLCCSSGAVVSWA
jgi:hypothetical protein